MGNCAGPKRSRSEGCKQKMQAELKEGEQIITYNGKPYIINVNQIYQKKQTSASSENNNNNKQKSTIQDFNFNDIKQGTSIILDKTDVGQNHQFVIMNGKNEQFILQTLENNNLYARRIKGSLNDIPTNTNILSPTTIHPSKNQSINHNNNNQQQYIMIQQQPIQIYSH